MSINTLFIPSSTISILLLLFSSFHCSTSLNNNPTSSCPSSSCGDIRDIRYPFRLKTDPISCGHSNTSYFELDCHNNLTLIINLDSRRYYIQEINYQVSTIRVVDPGITNANISSCPLYSYTRNNWPSYFAPDLFSSSNAQVAFVHCQIPINSVNYLEAPFCGNRSSIFANSSEFHSYALVTGGIIRVSDLEESCELGMVNWVSNRGPMMKDNHSLASIYDGLVYGFELSYHFFVGKACWTTSVFRPEPGLVRKEKDSGPEASYTGFHYIHRHCCFDAVNPGNPYICKDYTMAVTMGIYIALAIALLIILRFITGLPLLIWLVVHKWRRRHLSVDKTIEEFLQDQINLAPIRYTYSEIKKMTNNFTEKLGEGAYGTVFKGKLRSGPYVAVKMMKQSMSNEEEFISEVGTIGRIHHVSIVQLIGFCVEHSNYALVYEFLPNGSLDRYIFNQQSLDIHALSYQKMFEIVLGVASGINYLHHGCDMQILHFDIKPHNILLDEKFNPKISDFGLAQLNPSNVSFINLPSARGTVGYMAPEMFYRNTGCISYKADVYSFGMMLMEIASRRKNMNPFVENTGQVYFPSWAYDQLSVVYDIDVKNTTEEERKLVKKIIIVALWCTQMKPSKRPSMNRIVEMLEGEGEPQMPPKPFVAPHEIATADHGITKTYTVDYIHMNLADN